MNQRDAAALRNGLADVLGEIVAVLRREQRAAIRELEQRLVAEMERKGIDYRGVYRKGQAYAKGHAVTSGGSLWIAVENYVRTPGEPNSGWKLACKKGRDGKDAR